MHFHSSGSLAWFVASRAPVLPTVVVLAIALKEFGYGRFGYVLVRFPCIIPVPVALPLYEEFGGADPNW